MDEMLIELLEGLKNDYAKLSTHELSNELHRNGNGRFLFYTAFSNHPLISDLIRGCINKTCTIPSLPSGSQITRSIIQYRYDELSTQRLSSVASKAAPKVCAHGYHSLTDCD
jgi:hypothetical protein